MLILSRYIGETLMIGDSVAVTVLGVKGNQVRIGINAPKDVEVHREEIYMKIQRGEEKPSKKESASIFRKGSVSRLVVEKGYGFIYSPGFDGSIFFHASNLTGLAFDELFEGTEVSFKAEVSDRGYIASEVRVA